LGEEAEHPGSRFFVDVGGVEARTGWRHRLILEQNGKFSSWKE